MPRAPIELSDHQKAEVETLAALLSQDQIADYFGIGRTTFYQICKRDPEVAERYKKGKAKAIAHVANGLLQKARAGCTTSSIFYLKTQAGWRETTHLEHSGAAQVDHTVSAGEKLKQFLDTVARNSNRIGTEKIDDAVTIDASAEHDT